jgi:hypothetical protein
MLVSVFVGNVGWNRLLLAMLVGIGCCWQCWFRFLLAIVGLGFCWQYWFRFLNVGSGFCWQCWLVYVFVGNDGWIRFLLAMLVGSRFC